MDFRILGLLEVLDRTGRSLPLGGAKQRALLAILLINANEVVPVERLMDDIWGEEVPPTAANALQVYVSQLRKILRAVDDGSSSDPIVTRPPGYLLTVDPAEFDLFRFDDLAGRGRQALQSDRPSEASALLSSALALWRGVPLVDFLYDPFAQIPMATLEKKRQLAVEDRIQADLALGRQAEVIPELEALIGQAPLSERPREQLMIAFYRADRQADALNLYEETRQILSDQLGIDPGPALQRLREAILRQDPSLELSSSIEPAGDTDLATSAESPHTESSGEGADLQTGEQADLQTWHAGSREGRVAPVTVLFADIVGSTSLGERLSSDEVRVVVGECISRMSHAIEEYGGTVQAYMGDGICAYFGIPRSHEDDSERAALAALRIRCVVDELAREVEAAWSIKAFRIRIGINAGRTVVGLVGGGAPQEVTFGDLSNVAARLEASADPGSIYVGKGVAERLSRGFALTPRGRLKVKGREEPVEAWELLDIAAPGEVPAATPLQGRDRELQRGRDVISDLEAGRGRILLIQGETGIGKSRLLSELRPAEALSMTWLGGRCRSLGAERPGWPFAQILRQWLGVLENEPLVVVRMKLRSRLEELFGEDAPGVLPLLGRLLSVEDPSLNDAVALIPSSELEARVRDAYVRWIERLAERGPLAVAIDDVHEADAETKELAKELLSVTDHAPLVLILAGRANVGPRGLELFQYAEAHFHHRTVTMVLESLSDEAIGALLEALAPTGMLDHAVRSNVVERAAGNPLFAEELYRMLAESGALERERGWTITMSLSVLTLPPALEGLLVSRIQVLAPPVLSLAQAASVIGLDVPAAVLEEVSGAIDMHTGIGLLLRGEILQERRRYPTLTYMFRHPMLREAALSTLTPGQARDLYTKVALAFERRSSDPDDEQLERLAYYYYRSNDEAKALEYLERAATRAFEQRMNEHATELVRRAKKVAAARGDVEAERRLAALG